LDELYVCGEYLANLFYRKVSGEPSVNIFLTKLFYEYSFLSRTVSANNFQQFLNFGRIYFKIVLKSFWLTFGRIYFKIVLKSFWRTFGEWFLDNKVLWPNHFLEKFLAYLWRTIFFT